MDLINLSAEPVGKLHSWLPAGLCAENIVFLPDACPGRYSDGPLHFLIHTGSRNESGLDDDLIDKPARFDAEFTRIVGWAHDSRATIENVLADT